MIRVLLVDDSEVTLMVLQSILEKEPDISVIGRAKNGREAIALASRWAPDIITMDINMPDLDGFVTTRKIMENTPTPIIIVSGIDNLEEIRASFRAVEAGALGVFRKPPGYDDPEFRSASLEFISAIRTFSEVKVIRRRSSGNNGNHNEPEKITVPFRISQDIRVVLIGASTGGPQAVQEILQNMKPDFSLPMVLVQHMSPGFIEGLSLWLKESTGFQTKIAEEGEIIIPGVLYIAPDGKHTGITSDLSIEFSNTEPEHNLRPSVSYLFRSAAKNLGSKSLGVLLTGMGSDGAEELLQIRQKGGCTIIQDRESSFVYGMPGAAEARHAGMFSLPPKQIAEFLHSISLRSL
ncbi:MAG: chemotaxis-specific protein-glutamate methyltransferase CheB [Methanomicrobiales archaeon]|nr:chemotaxis-specific protein-glutamate methyltransferase CheB [Methanomicrobiales archaeon]